MTAANMVHRLGAKADFLLLDGLARDSHPLVRASCAWSLSNQGPKRLRSLLLAMWDGHASVRSAIMNGLTANMDIQTINAFFRE